MDAGLLFKGLLVMLGALLHVSFVHGTVQPFVTPGVPGCYVSLSQYEYVEGLSKRCTHSYYSQSHCSGGYNKWFYCSKDHDCCLHEGCPACCTSQDSLNTTEVAGVVIVCVVFTIVVLIATYFIAGKLCKLRPNA